MLAVTLRENALTTLDALKTSLGIDPAEEDAQRDATLVQLINAASAWIYTVKQELTHGPVHSMKRYMVEKKGESNPK